jgi:hypothetical protein
MIYGGSIFDYGIGAELELELELEARCGVGCRL